MPEFYSAGTVLSRWRPLQFAAVSTRPFSSSNASSALPSARRTSRPGARPNWQGGSNPIELLINESYPAKLLRRHRYFFHSVARVPGGRGWDDCELKNGRRVGQMNQRRQHACAVLKTFTSKFLAEVSPNNGASQGSLQTARTGANLDRD